MIEPLRPAATNAIAGPRRIGDILRTAKLITVADAEAIAVYSDQHGVRFGEAAIALGLVSPAAVETALVNQFRRRPDAGEPETYPDVATLDNPRSVQVADYRTLAATLKQHWFKSPQGGKSLAVVSPDRGDGRTTTAANLAACFAQAGHATLLIDADMRFPRQQHLFRINDRFGLAGYLNGQQLGSVFHGVHGLEKLTILPVGGTPPDPLDLLLRPAFEELIGAASRRFEIVICDAPAASEAPDYQIIAAAAGAALVVTRPWTTRVRAATQLIDACRQLNVAVVGGIVIGGRR